MCEQISLFLKPMHNLSQSILLLARHWMLWWVPLVLFTKKCLLENPGITLFTSRISLDFLARWYMSISAKTLRKVSKFYINWEMSCQGSRWAMYISNWCWNIFILYSIHVLLAIYLNWWYLFTSQGSCFTLQWKLILNIFFKFWSHNIWDWSIIVFISFKKVHMSLGQKLVQCFITAFTDSIGFAVTSWIPNPFSFGKDNLMWSQNIFFLYVSKYWINNGFFFSAPLRLFHLAVSLLRRNSYDSLVSQYITPPFPKSS